MSRLIELKDAVDSEIDRLETLAQLLIQVTDELDAGAARGLALLLRDVADRLRRRLTGIAR